MFQMLQFLVCVCGGSNSTAPPVFSYSPLLDWLPATFLCLDSDSGVLGLVGLKGGRVLLVNCETGVVRARFSHNYRYVLN